MRDTTRQEVLLVLLLLVFAVGCFAAASPAAAQKLKVEEIVARHLTSIGTVEARTSIKNRFVTGVGEVALRLGGQGTFACKGQLLSEGRKFRMVYSFPALDYPGEQVAFDGKKVDVGQVLPSQRSSLSYFLTICDVIVKEGLLGGVLSTGWPLLDYRGRQVNLEYSGLKKIEGKQLHQVKYAVKKGPADFQITLYFDPETFRHARTQYRLIWPAELGSDPMLSYTHYDVIYTLTESFDKFKEVDGLILPHLIEMDLTIERPDRPLITHWNLAVSTIAHNQQVDAKSFAIR
jgi:hypothetical protein